MKKQFTTISAKIKLVILAISLACISINANAAALVNPSWSAGSLVAGATTTYTFTYTTATANPTFILYAIFSFSSNSSFTGIANCTVTVNGSPAAISSSSYVSSQICRLELTNTTVAAGSNIVVTAQATNATTAGTYSWYWIQTADGGGNAIDLWSSPPAVVITPATPSSPVATSANFITGSGLTANWNSVIGASAYYLDVATDNAFTNMVTGFNNYNNGSTTYKAVTGLNPVTTYYYRVRAYNGATSGNSNVISAATTKGTATVNLNNLSATYDGTAKSAGATTTPSGLTVTFTYNGSSTAPTAAGTYSVVGTVVDSSYQGSASGSLVISKGAASVSLGSLSATYNGSSQQATATTTPSGLTVTFTYNGSSTTPTNAGKYAVVGTVVDSNYTGSASDTLVISQATATVTLHNLTPTYNGSPKAATATTSPSGKTVTFTYNGSSTAPTNAGTYAVVATVSDANYQGTASGNLVISKGIPAIFDANTSAVYDGTGKSITVITNPSGLDYIVTYNDSTTLPVNAGTYDVSITIVDSNWARTATDFLVISQATATVTLDSLSAIYDGSSKQVTAVTTPSGLTVDITYNGSSTLPTDVGTYAVFATINDNNYSGSASDSLVISKGTATVSLDSLSAIYDGTSKQVTAITTPNGLTVDITYNGSSTVPVNAGTYAVVATVNDSNYNGSTSGTFTISKATAQVLLDSTSWTYDGSAKQATVTTIPAGLTVEITYNDSSALPINAGQYDLEVTVVDSNYEGGNSAGFDIAQATATVSLSDLTATYDGYSKQVTATTTPNGLTVDITYDGSSTVPSNAGTYAVVATINDANYEGSSSDSLVISKATATVSLSDLTATYDGYSKQVTATTTPNGLTVDITYDGSSTVPSNAGTYAVVAAINDANYEGSASDSLVISKATATVSLSDLTATYDGTSKQVTATTTPNGLTVDITYNGSSTVPSNAGTYAVVATINDANYEGSSSDSLVISKATATVSLSDLTATYDGTSKQVTATTTPNGLTVDITYNSSSTVPSNAGTYAVVATINDANYEGSSSDSLVIFKATATVSLSDLTATYDGTSKQVTATTTPNGLTVVITYDGSSTVPSNAGTYAVVATINDANYEGSSSDSLVISKATATVSLSDLTATYDGYSKQVTATTTPNGLTVDITYDGSSTVPSNAGTYAVVATINDANYEGSSSDSLVISKATATVSLSDLTATYDGYSKQVTATTTPNGLTVDITYDGSSTVPSNAGTYAVVATINDANYEGSSSDSLVISKATATVSLSDLTATYDGSSKQVTATTTPNGLTVVITYDGSSTVPSNAGTYAVVATINDANYEGSSSDSLVISKATATVSLSDLTATYDGSSKQVTATTTPNGLTVVITYDGSSTVPSNAGTYAVVATINDANYEGSASDSLVISKATATISLSGLAAVYDSTAKQATTTTTPNGLTVNITYNGSSTAPINAGVYPVVATINDANYEGSASDSLVISKATATVSLSGLTTIYNGLAKRPVVTTTPSGLNVGITYDGSSTAPTMTGTYSVVATIDDENYEGSASGTFIITITTGIAEPTLTDVKLYPNPASDFITVNSSSALKDIKVFDISGACIMVKENCAAQEKLDVRGLSKGTYFVLVQSLSGNGYYKFVIN